MAEREENRSLERAMRTVEPGRCTESWVRFWQRLGLTGWVIPFRTVCFREDGLGLSALKNTAVRSGDDYGKTTMSASNRARGKMREERAGNLRGAERALPVSSSPPGDPHFSKLKSYCTSIVYHVTYAVWQWYRSSAFPSLLCFTERLAVRIYKFTFTIHFYSWQRKCMMWCATKPKAWYRHAWNTMRQPRSWTHDRTGPWEP